MGDGLTDKDVVEGRHVEVHVQEHVFVPAHAGDGEALLAAQGVKLARGKAGHEVGLAGLEHDDAVGRLGHAADRDPFHVRSAAIVVGVRDVGDFLVLGPGIEAVGAETGGTDVVDVVVAPGIGLGGVGLHRLLVENEQAEDRQDRQEQGVRFGLADLDGVVVDLDDGIAKFLGGGVFAEHLDPETGDGADVGEEPADGAAPETDLARAKV